MRRFPGLLRILGALLLSVGSTLLALGDELVLSPEEMTAWQSRAAELEATTAASADRDAAVTLPAMQFRSAYGTSGSTSLWELACADFCGFTTGVPVPHRATIVAIGIDACDDDPAQGGIVVDLYRLPNSRSDAPQALHSLAFGHAGCGLAVSTLPGGPHLVDQHLSTYIVHVSFGGALESFQSVRVYYRPGQGTVVPTGTEVSLLP